MMVGMSTGWYPAMFLSVGLSFRFSLCFMVRDLVIPCCTEFEGEATVSSNVIVFLITAV